MNLKILYIKDGNDYKTILLDYGKAREEGRFVTMTISDTKEGSIKEGKDMLESVRLSGDKLEWH